MDAHAVGLSTNMGGENARKNTALDISKINIYAILPSLLIAATCFSAESTKDKRHLQKHVNRVHKLLFLMLQDLNNVALVIFGTRVNPQTTIRLYIFYQVYGNVQRAIRCSNTHATGSFRS